MGAGDTVLQLYILHTKNKVLLWLHKLHEFKRKWKFDLCRLINDDESDLCEVPKQTNLITKLVHRIKIPVCSDRVLVVLYDFVAGERDEYIELEPIVFLFCRYASAIFFCGVQNAFQAISVEPVITLGAGGKASVKYQLLLTIIFKAQDQKALASV